MWSESSDQILWIVGHSLVLRSILGWKRKSSHFFWGNFHVPCHLLIRWLNGDGFIANITCIQTTGTTGVSTCRPAYCFRSICGKSVLGTKVLENAVLERTTNFVWPAVQQVRDLCVYFLFSSFLLLQIFFHLFMIYRIGNQSINQSIKQSIYNVWKTWVLPPYLLEVMSKCFGRATTFYAIIC